MSEKADYVKLRSKLKPSKWKHESSKKGLFVPYELQSESVFVSKGDLKEPQNKN